MVQQPLCHSAAALQDGATTSCVSLRLSVCARLPELERTGLLGKDFTQKRGPHLLFLSLIYHLTQCVSVCVCKQKAAKPVDQHDKKTEKWLISISEHWKHVSVWEVQSINVITFPKNPFSPVGLNSVSCPLIGCPVTAFSGAASFCYTKMPLDEHR